MMIILDKKKALHSIMAKRHPKDGVESESQAPVKAEEVKDEDGNQDPLFVAAQDIMLAVKDGSVEQLMEALKAFVDMHAHK